MNKKVILSKMRSLKIKMLHRVYDPNTEKKIIEQFHRLYYDYSICGESYKKTFWLGALAMKCPLDLWIYQEIIFETKPDVIVECGTAEGGSALYLASILDLLSKGRVVTIDIKRMNVPKHKRITYLIGSTVSDEIVEKVKSFIKKGDKVMVILDSDHHKDHVLKELRIYGDIVTKGNYLIVEDTNLNGNPVAPAFGPGPKEAVEEFLESNKNYVPDKSREKFYLTFNPGGYLFKKFDNK